MVVSRKRRRTKKRRRATAGGGMQWGVLGEVTGSSRESMLAGGDCADGVIAPGRRVTWETLNLIYLCLFLLLYVSQLPLILPCPSFSQTHMNNLSVVHIRKSTQTNTTHNAILFLFKHYHSISSSVVSHEFLHSLRELCVTSVLFLSLNMNLSQKRRTYHCMPCDVV